MTKVTELGHCSVETTLAVVGEEWKPLILRQLCDWGSKHEAHMAGNGVRPLAKAPVISSRKRIVVAIG
jgi:hypothetical protein